MQSIKQIVAPATPNTTHFDQSSVITKKSEHGFAARVTQ